MKKLVALLVLSVGSAHGMPVLWTLDNVVTGSTGAVTGAFTYDAQTSVYSNIDLTYNASAYTQSRRPELADVPLTILNPSFTTESRLRVEADPSLSTAGTISIELWFSGELTDAGGVLDVTSGAFRAYLYNSPI